MIEDKAQTSGIEVSHGRRAQRREERRVEILDAAMAIVVDEGLGELSIAGLAKRVGGAVGAIYRYFPSKEAIVLALQEQAIEAYQAGLTRRLAELKVGKGRAQALRRILIGFGYYLEDAEREPLRHRLLDIMMSAPVPVLADEDAARIQGVLAPVLQTCRALLDDAVAAGALAAGDNEQRTHVLWALLHGLDHFRKRDRLLPEHLRVAELVREAMKTALLGFGAKPEDVAQAFR